MGTLVFSMAAWGLEKGVMATGQALPNAGAMVVKVPYWMPTFGEWPYVQSFEGVFL